MPNFTPNYDLTLPLAEEGYSVAVVNDNNTKIDTALNGLKVRIDNQDTKVASPTSLGQIIVGNGLTINASGVLSATAQTPPAASTTVAGIVQLNDVTNSTSITQAATANAVKKVNDAKVNKNGDTMTGDLIISKAIPRVYLQVPGVEYTTEFRNNASSVNDFGFDIYRKNIRTLHISPTGAVWVRDNAGVEFNLADLKSSVSNGKTAIASAISDGGVYTSPVETFANMANNIRLLYGGGGTGSMRYAYGSATTQIVLDVPAGTFGFTPKMIVTFAQLSSRNYLSVHAPASSLFPGSTGIGEATSRGINGGGSYIEETYSVFAARNGGFKINVSPGAVFPTPAITYNWFAWG